MECESKIFYEDRDLKCILPKDHQGSHQARWPPRGQYLYGLTGAAEVSWSPGFLFFESDIIPSKAEPHD